MLDPNALDEGLADVMRRLMGMRRILRGPDFETLVDALNVELDVAEMEAKGREIARTFRSRNNQKPSLIGSNSKRTPPVLKVAKVTSSPLGRHRLLGRLQRLDRRDQAHMSLSSRRGWAGVLTTF